MKKLFKKKKKGLFDYKFKMIYDPKLDEVDLEKLAPEKTAEVNRRLKNLKLPESFTNSTKSTQK